MLRHLTGASAILILLYWITHLTTRSNLVAFGLPLLGTVLAFVWAFWTLNERISSRAQPQVLGLEELELLKQSIRKKQGRATPGPDTPADPPSSAPR